MKNENESVTALTPLDEAYLHATGPVTVGMTNDYMFRIVFQENKYALKGLISSVLHMDPDNIKSLDIKNTVKLTKAGVKKSLKKSYVKTVKVKKAKVKPYKKIFKKSNSGRSVKVKK